MSFSFPKAEIHFKCCVRLKTNESLGLYWFSVANSTFPPPETHTFNRNPKLIILGATGSVNVQEIRKISTEEQKE